MITNDVSTCPKCGGDLKYYDRVTRIVRTKGRKTWKIPMRRLQCTRCGSVHRELPELIFPYNITDKDEISKIRRAAISDARNSTGASGKRTRITISDGEWTAIQSGAISDTTLSEILRYAEPKTVRERATPRRTTQLSDARISRIKAMANSGHTNAEIAEALGISTSAVSKYLNS